MNEHENEQEGQEGLSRRKMIQRTAAAGAVVWSTPVIMASPAGAQGAVESPGGGEEPDCVNVRVFGFKYEVIEVGSSPSAGAWRVVEENGVAVGQFVGLGNGDDCIAALTPPTGQAATECANRALVDSLIVSESTDETVSIQFPVDCDLAGASAVAKEGRSCDYTIDDPAALENNILVFEKEGPGGGVSNVQVRVRCCADEYSDDCPNGV